MPLFATWTLLGGLFQLLIIKGSHAVFVQVTPKEILALPHQKAEFLCSVGVPIQYCRVEVPGMKHLNLNPSAPPFEGVSYSGSGLHAGQCGVLIDDVKDINNGEIKCTLGIPTESQESSNTMRLIVAKPPRAPELEILKESDHFWAYKVGDLLRAVCIVRDGRPVANISWYLDDEPLPFSFLTPPTVVSGNQDDLQTIYQNLTKELRPSDNGKSLKCVASHPAITQNNFAYRQLNVTYPPLPQTNPIDKFGYVLGQKGIIAVQIEANPRPLVEWSIRDQVIKEGHSDNTGRLKAGEIEDLGRGHYEATLMIADINKQDTETQYILRAYNDMGTQDYVVLISTSPEPEGLQKFFRDSINYLELGVLPIIGIVISILIILILVFLIVFARMTGRWCFSGGERVIDYTGGVGHESQQDGLGADGVDNPHHQASQEYINAASTDPGTRTGLRHSGESSDTESVDVRPKDHKRRFIPPLKLSLFKRKDKHDQQPDEDDEERPKSAETVESKIPADEAADKQSTPVTPEGREGIVYAELDLANPNLKPIVKNDDDKTEYAEIVYTQKEGEEANKEKEEKNEPSSKS